MKQRLSAQAAPGALQAMYGLETYLRGCGLESELVHLIKMRVSQTNGCAYCLDMHSKDLRAAGETEQRIYMLDGWREAPLYSDRERAALAWAEAVTRVTEGHVPDDAYEEARRQFNETELANLTLAVTTINAWNRLAIAFRTPAGAYQPQAVPAHSS
jgi:AhpD family alkylhydroperoxidase